MYIYIHNYIAVTTYCNYHLLPYSGFMCEVQIFAKFANYIGTAFVHCLCRLFANISSEADFSEFAKILIRNIYIHSYPLYGIMVLAMYVL